MPNVIRRNWIQWFINDLFFAFCVVGLSAAQVLAVEVATGERGLPTTSALVDRDGTKLEIIVHRSSARPQRGTVVFTHGFPGGAVGKTGFESRKALIGSLLTLGFGAVEFNYVGSWANSGEFTWFGGVNDVEAVVRFLRTLDAAALGLDASNIVLVGHSYGGWVALTTAGRDSKLRCVAGLASSDLGKTGELARTDKTFRNDRIAMYEEVLNASPPMVRAVSATSLVDDAAAHVAPWSLINQTSLLSEKQLLLVAAEKDTLTPTDAYFHPLVDALKRVGATSLRTAVINGADHNFRQHRSELDAVVLNWIANDCKA